MGIPAPQGVDAAGLPNAGDQANAVVSGKFSAVGPQRAFAFRGLINLAIWAAVNTALTTTAGSTAATVASASGLAAGDAINSINVPLGTTAAVLSSTNVTLGLPPVTVFGTVNTQQMQIGGLAATAGLLGATVTPSATGEGATLPAGTTVTAILQAAVPSSAGFAGIPGIVEISNLPTTAPANGQQVPFDFAVTGNAVLVTGADANALFTGAAVDWSGTVQVEKSFDGGATWIVANTTVQGTLAQFTAGTPVNFNFTESEKNVLYRLNCTAYSSGTIYYRISQTGGAAESLTWS